MYVQCVNLPLNKPQIACLYVPDFRLQVALGELGGEPMGGLALVDPRDGRRRIVAASEAARLDGVRRGMVVVTALSLAPELTVRAIDFGELAEVHRELEAAVRSLTPQLESTGAGVIYASFGGLERRYDDSGPGGFLDDLRDAALKLEFPARVGMGSTRFVARCAAILERRGAPPIMVPAGKERDFLAPQSLRLLPRAQDEVEALEELGLRSLGELAELPSSGLVRRFGERGVELRRLARGEDRAKLIPSSEPRAYLQVAHSDYPITQTEPLLFLMRRPLSALLSELDTQGLAMGELYWELLLEDHPPLSGRARAASPASSPRLWSDLLRLSMERLALPSGVLRVTLEGCDVGPQRPEQERLVGPRRAPPGALSRTLAHLGTELLPGSFGLLETRPALLPEEREVWQVGRGSGEERRPPQAISPSEEGWLAHQDVLRLPLAYRKEDPPLPVEVEMGRAGPRCLRHRFGKIEVVRSDGPWDISGNWWDGPVRRRYFQVFGRCEIAWVYFEPDRRSWFLAGWLD